MPEIADPPEIEPDFDDCSGCGCHRGMAPCVHCYEHVVEDDRGNLVATCDAEL